ncbi:MAG: DNA-processing protein DprA [Gammaproteobacteria bacterium]|nr:DNA-processing protein DprA [Gammaproteobacteria bacterium]MDE2345256.1 DNA-processing protein DprA [Gammaproteobacteria bacterium]
MEAQEANYWLALIRTPGLGVAGLPALLARCGSLAGIFTASSHKLSGLAENTRQWLENPDWDTVAQDLRWLEDTGVHMLACTDPAYPPLLRQISDPPMVLFVRGNLQALSLPQLAMVGSRNPSTEGRRNAEEFSAYLSNCGLGITSGMAMGIDAASHRGALRSRGTTIAVWGAGLDKPYPPSHRELAEEIAEHGALVSEFLPGTPPLPHNFPRRNRIISGLSVGTLVVEAAQTSGSLITAHLASEQGREVFAIPGSIHNPMARGCHRLIREGAKLVESAGDILEELAPLLKLEPVNASVESPVPEPDVEDPEYRLLLNSMDHAPISVDLLVERTGLTPDVVSSMLLMLELQGQVEATPGGHYSRVTKRPTS